MCLSDQTSVSGGHFAAAPGPTPIFEHRCCSRTADALLRELRSRNVAHTLNKSGELVLGRKLPADLVELLPTEMIPSSVLRWHSEYKEGLMTKELLGAPRFHSRVAALRRYHLIAPVARKTPQQKRAEARAYLQRWRRERRERGLCCSRHL